MRRSLFIGVWLLTLVPPAAADDAAFNYPPTKRDKQVDDYHGTKVPDPFRWLEEDVRNSKDVADWVAAQNKVTFAYLHGLPGREAIKKRLTDLWNYEKYTAPRKTGGGYYAFSKNDGLQNQSVVYVQDKLDAEPQVLLDPNQWSKDGTVALNALAFSEDGKHAAYGVSEAGSDWSVRKIIEVKSRKVLDDNLKWVKFSGLSWTHDGQGFFYSRYPEPAAGQKFQGLPLHQKLYYHKLGADQAADELIYERPEQPKWTIGGTVTEDGRYLVIDVGDGTTSDKSRVYVKDLTDPKGKVTPLIDDHESVNNLVDSDGTTFVFHTDRDAPRGRVVAVSLDQPDVKNWKELIPQADATIEGVSAVGGKLFALYLRDARSEVRIFTRDGRPEGELKLPGIGTATGFAGKNKDSETFFTFTSFTTPPRIYRYDIAQGKSAVFREAKVRFNPDDYEVKQVFYQSKDGTKVPMFISHKKGLKLDGTNPTLLYGYGGFNISLTPGFSVSRLAWMEMGGVYAVANIRGGGEYGRDWHRAATKLNRPKAYEDFIAAAEWLIESKYTRPEKLAIQGGSNGGLLVGAVMCKRPELFGAALPAVGVMDMLRYHKFTAGSFWVDDYGSADSPEEFKTLLSYSPYHNLKPGTRYPATLVTTADTDDRVVPSHSFKFAAQLQQCHQGDNPVLIRIETRAGHGAGRPTTMAIEEIADLWAFLARNLKMELPAMYR